MKKLQMCLLVLFLLWTSLSSYSQEQKEAYVVHIKTSLSKDDAQICVAYNFIQAALKTGYSVSVIIDASAVNTYKRGWRGRDKLEKYKLPERLRQELAREFDMQIDKVPRTYGEYLSYLIGQGAKFYINGAMLVVSGISKKYGDTSSLSSEAFEVIDLKEIVKMISSGDHYVVY